MIKIREMILVILFCLIPFFSSGQEQTSVPQLNLASIAQENSGNSYITFPTDIGNLEPLWFEANLIPNFFIRQNKTSRVMAVLTPQIIIRMYREPSYPVRTPSYMPQITIYYSLGSKEKTETFNLFGRVGHHSNGQDGEFYLENGEINTQSGNFATNYFELGIIKTGFVKRMNSVPFFATSFEWHPKAATCPEPNGIYGYYRWNTTLSMFRLPGGGKEKKKRANISLKLNTSWYMGNINDWGCCSLHRLNFDMTFFYHPGFLEDLGLFAQYYHGSDYYNIYFFRQIDVLRFGIMTELLTF